MSPTTMAGLNAVLKQVYSGPFGPTTQQPDPGPYPQIAGRVMGVRAWAVDSSADMIPLGVGGEPWKRGVNTAECRNGDMHEAPFHDCACGLYARYTQEDGSSFGIVCGVIAAWGAIELHGEGFRAQYAEPLALICSHDAPILRRVVAEYTADHYGIPVLPHDKALALAAETTVEVPHDLRPAYDYDHEVWQSSFGAMPSFVPVPAANPFWTTTSTTAATSYPIVKKRARKS